MAYTYNPTDWKTGDIITEGKLNNIENGIKGLYPSWTPEVIAPEQTITITADTPLTGVPITFAQGKSIDENLWCAGVYRVLVDGSLCSQCNYGRTFEPHSAEDHYNYFVYSQSDVDIDEQNYSYACIRKVNNENVAVYTNFMAVNEIEDPETGDISCEPRAGSYTVSIILDVPSNAVFPKLLYGFGESWEGTEVFVRGNQIETSNGVAGVYDSDDLDAISSFANVVTQSVGIGGSGYMRILGGSKDSFGPSEHGAGYYQFPTFVLKEAAEGFRGFQIGFSSESARVETVDFVPDTVQYEIVIPGEA